MVESAKLCHGAMEARTMKVRYVNDDKIEITAETDFEQSFIGRWASVCTHMDNNLKTFVCSIGIDIILMCGAKEDNDELRP